LAKRRLFLIVAAYYVDSDYKLIIPEAVELALVTLTFAS
jgi:hypothetical protein